MEDDPAFPKASFDLLETIPVLPVGMEDGQQINIQCQVLEIGDVMGDGSKRAIRVTDEMGEDTDAAGGVVGVVDRGRSVQCNGDAMARWE